MTQGKPMSLGALITVFAVIIGSMSAIVLPAFDDIFWQVAEGRAVLAGHIPSTVPAAIHAGTWIDHEWLFEALAAFAYDHHGYPVFVGLCAFVGAMIPILIFLSLRTSDEHDIGAGFAALCAALVTMGYDMVRALEFGAGAFTLLLYLLRKRIRNPWYYFAVAVVWANFHASVVLGPIMCVIFSLAAAYGRDREFARAYAVAAAAMIFGSLCTPSSTALYIYAASHLGTANSSTQYIHEWDPFQFAGIGDWLSVGTIIIGVIVAWQRKEIPLVERFITGVFIIFALHQKRQVAFIAPACAGVLVYAIPSYAANCFRLPIFGALAAGIAIAEVAVMGPKLARANILNLNYDLPPLFAKLPPRIEPVNAYIDYNIAGYAEFINAPLRLLIDSHADCFSKETWHDANTLDMLTPGWQDVLKRNDIRLVVVMKKAPIAQALALLPQWSTVAEQGTYIAFAEMPASESRSSVMLSNSPISMRSTEIRSRARATRSL